MIRYYAWALAEKTLSVMPGGKLLYRRVGRIVKDKKQGTGTQLATSFPLARRAKELTRPGGNVLDIGTGWFHHDAFLIYLMGSYHIYLFDVEDRGQLNYIRNYLSYLRQNVEWVAGELRVDADEARAKLSELLTLPDRASIYKMCNFTPCITDRVDRPFLPEGSIDFMVSNCVLVHIRPALLVPELTALGRMLSPEGCMYHMLGHDDHWAFHDRSMPWPSFQYLRYSDRAYRLVFDTQLEYHNRMVRPEWLEIFREAELEILEYEAVINDASRSSVRSLPRLASRYASYPSDDLSIIYSYVLLRRPNEAHARHSAAPLQLRPDVAEVGRPLADGRPYGPTALRPYGPDTVISHRGADG